MGNVLLTGGFGYIGSHIAVVLAEKNIEFIIYDNFSNSKFSVKDRLEKTIGKSIKYVQGDIRDTRKLIETFKNREVDSVIHLAALKSVEESIAYPLKYYENNQSLFISLALSYMYV